MYYWYKKRSRNIISREKASRNKINEERLKNYNTVLGGKSKPIPSIYHPLFEKLKKINFYQYIIISPEDIEKWYGSKISSNESANASNTRRGRFKKNMVFPNLSYSFYL